MGGGGSPLMVGLFFGDVVGLLNAILGGGGNDDAIKLAFVTSDAEVLMVGGGGRWKEVGGGGNPDWMPKPSFSLLSW